MQVFIGRDDRGRDFGSPQQFAMIGRKEISPDLFRNEFSTLGTLLGDADPFDRGMARGDFAPEQADAPTSDDRQANRFSRFSHVALPSCHGSPPSPRWTAADR